MQIIVVGSGLVGLSCAYRLAEAGHGVTVVSAGKPAESTSAIAGGLIYPPIDRPDERVLRWTVRGLEGVKTQWSLLCATLNLRVLYGRWRAGNRPPAAPPLVSAIRLAGGLKMHIQVRVRIQRWCQSLSGVVSAWEIPWPTCLPLSPLHPLSAL